MLPGFHPVVTSRSHAVLPVIFPARPMALSPSHLCGRISPAGCAGCPVSPDPEGHFARHTLREIGEIGFRTEAADALDPQQDPLRMRIDTADRQRMGIFRTKAVDHIRVIIFRDLTQFSLQLRLVTVRMHGILMEAVASDEISTAPSEQMQLP